jgi:hypothetical protein
MPRSQTPYAIAEATGAAEHNPKRYKARKVAPQPEGVLGDPPNYFDEQLGDMWREIANYAPPGVLTSADRFLVEITSKLLHRFRSLHPDDKLSPVELGHLRSCLGSMGLTPADRGRVTSAKPQQQKDPLDAILSAKGTGKAN